MSHLVGLCGLEAVSVDEPGVHVRLVQSLRVRSFERLHRKLSSLVLVCP